MSKGDIVLSGAFKKQYRAHVGANRPIGTVCGGVVRCLRTRPS